MLILHIEQNGPYSTLLLSLLLLLLLLLSLLLQMFSVLYIASYTLLEPGSILGPEVSGQFFIRWTETFSVCAPFLGGWSFAAHLCYWLQRFFLKFWSIPSLKCQCTNNNRHSLCPHSPHSHGFSLKIFVFWELFNDFCRGVSVGWYWYSVHL